MNIHTISSGINTTKVFTVDSNKHEPQRLSLVIVPFFLRLFSISKDARTTSISDSIRMLDDLAIKYDSIIDNANTPSKNRVLMSDFPDVKNEIEKCLYPISGFKNHQNIMLDTLKMVELSFRLNSDERSIAYSLTEDHDYSEGTMLYLLPLFMELTSTAKVSARELRKLFVVFSTYVQLLDDLVDLPEDVQNLIHTPLSTFFLDEETDSHQLSGSHFSSKCESVVHLALRKLTKCQSDFDKSVKEINPHFEIDTEMIQWHKFQSILTSKLMIWATEVILLCMASNDFHQIPHGLADE